MLITAKPRQLETPPGWRSPLREHTEEPTRLAGSAMHTICTVFLRRTRPLAIAATSPPDFRLPKSALYTGDGIRTPRDEQCRQAYSNAAS